MIINLPSPLPILKPHVVALANGETLLTVIHNAGVAYAAVYRVDINNIPTLIGRSESQGKDDSAASLFRANGDVEMYVSEADPGQSGSTSRIHIYKFPLAVPAQVPNTTVDEYAREQIAGIKAGLITAGS